MMFSRPGRATVAALGSAVLLMLPVFGILTWTREFPSLSLHCQFPHCKHFNDLCPHGSEKASKKPLTQSDNLVSRKSVAKLQPLPKLTKYFHNFF